MKELEFLEIIKNNLSKKAFIGDDCAYLSDLGIVVTQDSLVEDIHFSLEFSTPFQLGYKAIVVNLSDIFASGAIPKYFTISLSLPSHIEADFVKEFYKACDELSKKYDFEVIGGDITGSDKIFISVCAIGVTKGRKISSRSNAKIGDYVVTTGVHGSSAAGLWLLQKEISEDFKLVESHLMPIPQKDFSTQISSTINRDYAMMDTSDGLVDALYKIAQSSNVLISVDFSKIPFDKNIEHVAKMAKIDYYDWIFYGGEDYQMIACVDEENLKKLDGYTIIGQVKEKTNNHFVEINIEDEILKISDLEKSFNHFRENSND